MSNPDKSIDPRILASAREEFLSKPYEQVSLREICQKAGVTTGAFYNRYKNKEELFDALVAPTLETLKSYSDGIESFNYDHLERYEADAKLLAEMCGQVIDGDRTDQAGVSEEEFQKTQMNAPDL